MIILRHVSASSITKFAECPSSWATTYDKERGVRTRNKYSDAGNLVHRALEIFRSPERQIEKTYEKLEACFNIACAESKLAEDYETHKRALEILPGAFRLELQNGQTLSVEQPLASGDSDTWKLPEWPIPVKGFIDRIALIPNPKTPNDPWAGCTLDIEDTKTGRQKTHAEIIEDIQNPLYMLYAREELIPYLAHQNIFVEKIIGSWTYVSEGSVVTIQESDVSHEATRSYVASISKQMLAFAEAYNEAEASEKAQEFLARHEKTHKYCFSCPRASACKSYKDLAHYSEAVDLTGNIDWKAVWEERQKYSAAKGAAEKRLDMLNDTISLYLEFENLPAIPVPELGLEITASQGTLKRPRARDVKAILGEEFVLQNASITQKAIEQEVASIAKTQPTRAKEVEKLLESAYSTFPGARRISSRKYKLPKPQKEG